MICPVLLRYPDEFIPNAKVVRNRSTNPDTPHTRVSDVHDTSGMILPPPDPLSGNHPELAVHPRMNSRSEQRASYYVRASIAFHLSCNTIDCYACFVFIVCSPLSLSDSPTTDADAPLIDHVVDDRVPLPSSFQASRATSALPHIAYFSIFICGTRHM